MRPDYDTSGQRGLPGPSEIPHRTWSILRIWCIGLAVGVTALILGTCATVGVVAWRQGWWVDPPELPVWARPAGTDKLYEDVVWCTISDDWLGREYRLMVFGTNRSYEPLQDELE